MGKRRPKREACKHPKIVETGKKTGRYHQTPEYRCSDCGRVGSAMAFVFGAAGNS